MKQFIFRARIAVAVCVLSYAGFARAERVQGVDVSQFQISMNWNTTYNAGVRFAFIRATRGGPLGGYYLDPQLDQNMTGSGAAGLLRGAYHYARPGFIAKFNSTPGTGNDQPTSAELITHATSEADYFYTQAGQYIKNGYMRPVLDLEEYALKDQYNQNDPNFEPLTASSLTLWADTFIDHLQTLTGTEAVVYTNSTIARDYLLPSFAEHDLWLARYSVGHPNSVDPQTSNPEKPSSSWANPYGIWNNPIGGARRTIHGRSGNTATPATARPMARPAQTSISICFRARWRICSRTSWCRSPRSAGSRSSASSPHSVGDDARFSSR